MYAEAAQPNYDPSAIPLAPGYANQRQAKRSGLRLIRSVVETSGLGGFAYLEGASGKRYVFSSIRAEQVSLYDDALFAATSVGGELVNLSKDFSSLKSAGQVYYVHLLANNEDALADLNEAAA